MIKPILPNSEVHVLSTGLPSFTILMVVYHFEFSDSTILEKDIKEALPNFQQFIMVLTELQLN